MAGETSMNMLANELGCSLRTIQRLREEGHLNVQVGPGRPRYAERDEMARVAKVEADRLRPILAARSRPGPPIGHKPVPKARDILGGSWTKLAHDPERVLAAMPVLRDEMLNVEERLATVEGRYLLEQEEFKRTIYHLEQQVIERDIEIKRLNAQLARLRNGV